MTHTNTMRFGIPTICKVVLASSCLFFAAAAGADVRETEEFNYDANDDVRIALENINGDIVITGDNNGQVRILAHKKAGKQEYLDELVVSVDASDEYIRIETNHPESDGWFNWGGDSSGSVSYELSVPSGSRLDTVTTINGTVEIESVSGVVKVETVNGSVEASGLRSDASMETVNGSVTARFEQLGDGQRVNADAVNGKIILIVPSDASARVNADTVNGSIRVSDFDLEVEKGFVGRSVSGEIGSGDGRISVDTVNGSVTIKSE